MPAATAAGGGGPGAEKGKSEGEILFQDYFKSVGPRTYAAQVKRSGNGNHFLVLTEGKRDDKSGEVRKIRLFLFSEDFGDFFRMLHKTAQFIRENPVPPEIAAKRKKFWDRQNGGSKSSQR
ncbi:MAG TPA: DUF3276 family protein [Tepidisphaeraceae bacterium]